MRILIVTQYFWPEQFRINNVVENLLKQGHSVDVLTGIPNYPEGQVYQSYKKNKKQYDKFLEANIFRVPIILRGNSGPSRLFFNYLSFVISAIFFGSYKLRKKKYDIIFTFATSPITVALPAIYFSFLKNAKHALWVLDLWPYILGELQFIKNKFTLSCIAKVVRFIYSKSDLILAQSNSFKEIISKQVNEPKKIFYFPSWSEKFQKKQSNFEKLTDLINYNKKFNIVFTGNVGEAQNFDNIVIAAEMIKNEPDIQWIVVGTGRKIADIKKQIEKKKIKNFIFVNQQDHFNIPKFHEIASVLLVSLRPDKYLSMTIPGKVSTYMNSNKFILGFISGETANMLQQSKAGIAVDPSKPQELAKTIVKLKNNPEIINKVVLENFGRKFVKTNFDEVHLMNKLNKYLLDVLEQFIIIKDLNQIPFDRNFSLSGLNLAFLGYWSKKKIIITKNIYLWPDGIFYKRFFNHTGLKKIPGREIVNKIKIPDFIKKIYVIGNLDNRGKKYLENIYNKQVVHISLGHEDVQELFEKNCKIQFLESDLIFLTLPTPKQEQFSQLIMDHSKFFKIICIGGAINMASGTEKPVPKLLDYMNLEFLWRLKTDPVRRLRRLLVSGLYYIRSEIFFKFNNLNKKTIDEK